jgi:hypothetical protein
MMPQHLLPDFLACIRLYNTDHILNSTYATTIPEKLNAELRLRSGCKTNCTVVSANFANRMYWHQGLQ